jgi:hypothetical protein
MFISGTGSNGARSPASDCHSGTPRETAAARATASETARIAFAPSRPLFSVPSRSIMMRSMGA